MNHLSFRHLKKFSLALASLSKSSLFLSSSLILAFNVFPARGFQLDFGTLGSDRLDNGDASGVGATMTYETVATVDSIDLNLIVTTLDEYSGDTTKNGNLNTASPSADGRINITANTSTTFRFSLVNAADNSPYVADTLEFGLFDIDGNNNGAMTNPRQEKVILYTSANYEVTDPNNFESITSFDDRVEFLSQDVPVNLPSDSSELLSSGTELEQEQHAVKFTFNDVSEFKLAYEVIGGNSTRNFYFAGDLVFDETTQIVAFQPVPFEFSPGLGLLMSGVGLLGIHCLKKKKPTRK